MNFHGMFGPAVEIILCIISMLCADYSNKLPWFVLGTLSLLSTGESPVCLQLNRVLICQDHIKEPHIKEPSVSLTLVL